MFECLGIVLTAFGILFVYLQWLVPLRKMRKELFNEFNNRYQNLRADLQKISNIDLKSQNEILLEKLDDELRKTLITYFILCAEEYYWFKRVKLGGIDRKIWESWEVGMNDYYNNNPIMQKLWEDEIKGTGYKSYYLERGEKLFTLTKDSKY